MEPIRTLVDDAGASPSGSLPAPLAELYGGGLNLDGRLVYANVVASIDGVVALEGERGSGSAISGRNLADRFLMGLLRCLADAILIGAGTLRADGGQPWTGRYISPEHEHAYALLSRPDPLLAVATLKGHLDPGQPEFESGALVLTTDEASARLSRVMPAATRVLALGPAPLGGRRLVEALRAEACERVLTEGGPGLLASLLADGVLDELFLTVSPVLAGRLPGSLSRPGLADGVQLLPKQAGWARLRSVKSQGSHLFLRYALREARRSGAE
jgi:riboflavin biosynthesis pyrimidine reductase